MAKIRATWVLTTGVQMLYCFAHAASAAQIAAGQAAVTAGLPPEALLRAQSYLTLKAIAAAQPGTFPVRGCTSTTRRCWFCRRWRASRWARSSRPDPRPGPQSRRCFTTSDPRCGRRAVAWPTRGRAGDVVAIEAPHYVPAQRLLLGPGVEAQRVEGTGGKSRLHWLAPPPNVVRSGASRRWRLRVATPVKSGTPRRLLNRRTARLPGAGERPCSTPGASCPRIEDRVVIRLPPGHSSRPGLDRVRVAACRESLAQCESSREKTVRCG